jgi:hypothetical protein
MYKKAYVMLRTDFEEEVTAISILIKRLPAVLNRYEALQKL